MFFSLHFRWWKFGFIFFPLLLHRLAAWKHFAEMKAEILHNSDCWYIAASTQSHDKALRADNAMQITF